MRSTACAFYKQPNFVTRRVAGQLILVPVGAGAADLEAIYTFSEVGSRIWELMDEQTGAEGIAAAIAAEYAVDPAEARRDVDEFLAELAEVGLAGRAAEGA